MFADLGKFANSRAVGYLVLLAYQSKVFWFFWSGKDLTMGDTAQYFRGACTAFREQVYSISWSPLYTAFYSLFLHLSDDPYIVTMTHRLVILLACSVLVYEIMRRLLPAYWGLLLALWWLALPANHNPLYEIHSFALMFVLLSWLVLVTGDSPCRRGIAMSVLGLAALFIRNELIVMLVPFAAAVIIWEWRRNRVTAKQAAPSRRALLAAYMTPWIPVLLVGCYFVTHADKPFTATINSIYRKQTFNFGQIYSFVYGKSDPDWVKKNPWTNYRDLIEREFGTTDVTLASAFVRNPGAMMRHVATNGQLTVGGLQIGLLGSRGIEPNPDYGRGAYFPIIAWSLTPVLVFLFLAGLVTIVKNWRAPPGGNIVQWKWSWLMLGCAVVHGLFICLTLVPRPAFVFPLLLACMAVVAMGASALVDKWRWSKQLRFLTLPLLVILCFDTPSPWKPLRYDSQWSKEVVQALTPHSNRLLTCSGKIALTSYQPQPAVMYATLGKTREGECIFDIRQQRPSNQPLSDFLVDRGVCLLHLDARILSEPVVKTFVEAAERNRWKLLAKNKSGRPVWLLYRRD